MLISGLCAFRAPNTLTITLAYIQVFFRIIQLVGTIFHNNKGRIVSEISYTLATICIIIMFFSVMIHGLNLIDLSGK